MWKIVKSDQTLYPKTESKPIRNDMPVTIKQLGIRFQWNRSSTMETNIFTPIIGMILAGINFNDLGITIPWGNRPYINIGSFIQAVISFLITAFCIFIIVKFINAFKKKEEEKPAEPPKAPEPTKEEVLLTEIRDMLKAQQDKE